MNAARRVNKIKIEHGLETSGNSVRIGTANSPLARGVALKHGAESPGSANSNSAKCLASRLLNRVRTAPATLAFVSNFVRPGRLVSFDSLSKGRRKFASNWIQEDRIRVQLRPKS
jgi:hypothetical protein